MPLQEQEPTILAGLAGRLVRYGASRGLDPQLLCRIAGATPEHLQTQGAYVPISALFALLVYVTKSLDDPGVPIHVAKTINIEDLHIMGFAIMTAHSGRAGFERAVRYSRLLTNSSEWVMIPEDRGATLRVIRHMPLELGPRLGNEGALADFVHCARQTLGYEFLPTRVAIQHARPRDIRAHEELFRCPIEFGAPHNEFSVTEDLMTLVPRQYNPTLSTFFVEHAEKLLQERGPSEESLVARVRREIADELPSGAPSLDTVARRLAMSGRSLRRYLGEASTSFSQILDQVRYERAQALLRSSSVSVGEIAFLLGFSNVSTFSRAFKKWSGVAPVDYRAPG